jgi:hypothetical protein
MTPTDAAATVAKNLETALTQVKTLGAKDILTNFDAIMVDPVTFSQNFTPIETTPPPGITPEQEVEQVGDVLSDSYFKIIEEEEKKRIK